jgi:hypothetical protein
VEEAKVYVEVAMSSIRVAAAALLAGPWARESYRWRGATGTGMSVMLVVRLGRELKLKLLSGGRLKIDRHRRFQSA